MNERIIISIVAILMLLFSFNKKDKWTIVLTSLLTLGIIITWIQNDIVITSGLLIYALTGIFISTYGYKKAGENGLLKTTIVLSGLFTFLSNLSMLMQLPFANITRMSMLIPLVCYLLLIRKSLLNKKEFSFLTIMNTDFLLKFLRIWN